MSRLTYSVFQELEDSIEFDFEMAKLEFALELQRLMDEKEINKASLAELLDVSRPMISKLLKGDANVTIETMVKASRALGGKLFLKIIRDNCLPRLFEIAKSEVGRFQDVQSHARRGIKHAKATEWNFLPSASYPNMALKGANNTHETKPIAA